MACGSVVKRPGGYYIVYRIGGKQKWERAGQTKKQAEQLLITRMSDVNAGLIPTQKKILFREFASAWLADYAKIATKESTYRSYEDILRLHLLPTLGDRLLSQITAGQIQSLLASKISVDRLSPKSVVNMIVPLKEMFKHALEWGYIARNPTTTVKRPRLEHKEMDFLTPEEIPVFLQAVNPSHQPLFATAILTGMRRGELLAVKWEDIDWRAAQICVRRSLYRGKFVTPKTKSSLRRIIMTPFVRLQLEELRTQANPNHDLTFCTENGTPLHPDNMVKREFHPALERAGIRRIRFQDLRHTFASLLIANGENIKFVQQQLGHASAKTTLDIYGHLFPGGQNEAAKRLDNVAFGNPVSKLLDGTDSVGSSALQASSQVIDTSELDLVAGAGFEPATFGL